MILYTPLLHLLITIITPEVYLESSKNDDFQVRNVYAGVEDQSSHICQAGGGSETIDTSEEDQNSWSASDQEVKDLAEMAVKIEKHYGRPMDRALLFFVGWVCGDFFFHWGFCWTWDLPWFVFGYFSSDHFKRWFWKTTGNHPPIFIKETHLLQAFLVWIFPTIGMDLLGFDWELPGFGVKVIIFQSKLKKQQTKRTDQLVMPKKKSCIFQICQFFFVWGLMNYDSSCHNHGSGTRGPGRWV